MYTFLHVYKFTIYFQKKNRRRSDDQEEAGQGEEQMSDESGEEGGAERDRQVKIQTSEEWTDPWARQGRGKLKKKNKEVNLNCFRSHDFQPI